MRGVGRGGILLQRVFVLVCVLSSKCGTVALGVVGTLEKTNVHLLLRADRGHDTVPLCNNSGGESNTFLSVTNTGPLT